MTISKSPAKKGCKAGLTAQTSLTKLSTTSITPNTNSTDGSRVIYWFRTDLRLHDSPALTHALSLNPSALYCIWTWDPHYVYRARVGTNRFNFLLDCQRDLSESLTKLNPKQKLLVVREAPQTVLPKLCKEWDVQTVVWEKDTDAYANERDREVEGKLREMGVECVSVSGRTLWDSDELVRRNGGKGTFSLSQVQHAGEKIGPIAHPLPGPTSLPDPGSTSLSFSQEQPSPTPDYNAATRASTESSYTSISGPNHDFSPPTATELGLKSRTSPHIGGETHALSILSSIIARKEYTATFEKPATAPTAFAPQSTTLLSPHLHFGSLSVREFYWRVQDAVDAWDADPAHKARKASKPPTSLTGQLLFRDMYFGAQAALGFSFGQAFNNPACRFIPWHLPSRIDPATKLITGAYDIDTPQAEQWFQRWKYGRTGFPWIDALMRQLRTEGWIHHLGRHAVASFLTRGGCYIDWERGAEVFEEWLVDHEAASNIGNWQWLACAAFFSQFYRVYSPVAFPQKWDPEGEFVRRYVPELRRVGKKYIYEPWKAPVVDAKGWGVLVKGDGMVNLEKEVVLGGKLGRNGEEGVEGEGEGVEREGEYWIYPKPMFDFAERREICIKGMKKAYEVGLKGNDPRVLDGSWRALFGDDAEGPTEGTKGPMGAMVVGVDGERAVGSGEGDVRVKSNGTGDVEPKSPVGKGRGVKRGQTTLDGLIKRVKK